MSEAPPPARPAWRGWLARALADWHIKRRLATADGGVSLYVSPGSELRVLDPRGVRVDPVHARFIARYVGEDAVVWDIGANQGLFGLPAALKAARGQVYLFEPDVQLAHHLLRSARLNPALRVRIAALALSDHDGVAEFLIAAHGKTLNKLAGASPWRGDRYVVAERRSVACLTIDTVAATLPKPDVIKIDVEGAELRVLEGGRRTIAAARPAMLIEAPSQIAAPIAALLASLDYVMRDGGDESRPRIEAPVWDTIALPRERSAA